ncbi:hypothetical protein BB559_002947 [Furculomyces boomerangus]|uniref:Uncharacterized protein n=1 Tax=Furculomyces boomerangus TaxID=61424 RepID=A0A2T9YQM3_9FUNG|nr:hypothetical protein BB559_002947 [Furculomyces boomerangus]
MFPVEIKQNALLIDGCRTESLIFGYSNAIVILITQCNNIGSLMKITLDISDSKRGFGFNRRKNYQDEDEEEEDSEVIQILPHTIKFLLGNPVGSQRGDLYNVYASRLAQVIYTNSPHEKRSIYLGLSLKSKKLSGSLNAAGDDENKLFSGSEDFVKQKEALKLIEELVEKCKVW